MTLMDSDLKENFKVRVGEVEGPLELILDLIEKRKLHISDVSLSQVADDFIEYIKSFEEFPIADSADFILVASTLLLIKSKSLLPTLSLTEEEEEGIHDLETRLKIYKRIKDASLNVQNLFGKSIIFSQSQQRKIEPIFSPHQSMNLLSLAQAIKDIIKSLPKKENVPKAVVRKVISLEETIDNLTKRITQGLKMKFSDFSGSLNKTERVNVIVSFLAMLELVKQGIIHVSQEQNFGDINMESKEIGVPRYN